MVRAKILKAIEHIVAWLWLSAIISCIFGAPFSTVALFIGIGGLYFIQEIKKDANH